MHLVRSSGFDRDFFTIKAGQLDILEADLYLLLLLTDEF